MIYGYARVSTNGQAHEGNSLDAQVLALRNAGAVKIFSDVFSGTKNSRPQLDKLLKVIQSGDTLIITKLDRIARSLIQGIQLLESLSDKGVIIDVLNMGIIDNSPTGRLIRNIMLCFSEFERDMILQRTMEGKASSKSLLILSFSCLSSFMMQTSCVFFSYTVHCTVSIAKQNANYREGRPKKFKRIQLQHALELLQTHSYKQVSTMTGISITTIYRAKRQAQPAQ